MTDAPFIAHDFSPFSGACVNCGVMFEGSRPECEPTTAEPDSGDAAVRWWTP